MAELVLIQRQLKRQQQLKNHALVRWNHQQERNHAAIKALGEALKASK
jgi:ribosomal protein L35